MERPRSWKTRLTRMAHDNSGIVAIIVAILLPVFIGFAALAIDISYALWTRTQLQHTASAAALAGVIDLVDEAPLDGMPDNGAYRNEAVEYAYKNMAQSRFGRIIQSTCGTYDPGTGTVSGSAECADVKAGDWDPLTRTFTAWDDAAFDTLTMELDAVRAVTRTSEANGNPLNLFLSAAVGLAQTDISTAAIAWTNGGGGSVGGNDDDDFCIIALAPTGWRTLRVDGSANLTLNCGVAVNSNHPSAFEIAGESTLVATKMGIVGGYYAQGASDLLYPDLSLLDPDTGVEPFEDPLSSLVMPPPAPCDHEGFQVSGSTTTISPGVYCDGLVIKDGATVTFEPGVYIIDGGEPGLFIKDNAHTYGTDVTFLLTGGAQAHIMGGSVNELSAPTSGDYGGVLIYQDRNSPACVDQCNRINGETSGTMLGALYFPQQEVEVSGSADFSSGCLRVIAWTVVMNGGTSIGNDCETLGYTRFAGGSGSGSIGTGVTYRLVD